MHRSEGGPCVEGQRILALSGKPHWRQGRVFWGSFISHRRQMARWRPCASLQIRQQGGLSHRTNLEVPVSNWLTLAYMRLRIT